MKVIEPTPSQGAMALQKSLAAQGIKVKLGQAQEAYARSRGYASWNVLCSQQPARRTPETLQGVALPPPPYPESEGLELWAITCRVCGDDDDSLYLEWGFSQGEAEAFASEELWLDDGGNVDEMESDQIYLINATRVGVIHNGQFELDKFLNPPSRTAMN